MLCSGAVLKTCGSQLGLGTGVCDAGGTAGTAGSQPPMNNNSEKKKKKKNLDSDLIRNRNNNVSY